MILFNLNLKFLLWTINILAKLLLAFLDHLLFYSLIMVCVCVCAQSCLTLQPHGLQPARLLCPWDSPGKIFGVGFHFLFQGIFQTQGLDWHHSCLLHWQAGFLRLCNLGSPNNGIRDSFLLWSLMGTPFNFQNQYIVILYIYFLLSWNSYFLIFSWPKAFIQFWFFFKFWK